MNPLRHIWVLTYQGTLGRYLVYPTRRSRQEILAELPPLKEGEELVPGRI
jgi:hypothetical protein